MNDPTARVDNPIFEAHQAVKILLHSVMRLPPQYVTALSGDPAEQVAATDKVAEALAKAQDIPVDQVRKLLSMQYKDALARAKEQAKQAADATAKAVSRGALFGALALMLGALAAFFAGKASAGNPTVTGARHFS